MLALVYRKYIYEKYFSLSLCICCLLTYLFFIFNDNKLCVTLLFTHSFVSMRSIDESKHFFHFFTLCLFNRLFIVFVESNSAFVWRVCVLKAWSSVADFKWMFNTVKKCSLFQPIFRFTLIFCYFAPKIELEYLPWQRRGINSQDVNRWGTMGLEHIYKVEPTQRTDWSFSEYWVICKSFFSHINVFITFKCGCVSYSGAIIQHTVCIVIFWDIKAFMYMCAVCAVCCVYKHTIIIDYRLRLLKQIDKKW